MDPSTKTTSLSERDKAHFWNDQCSCTPPCWVVPQLPSTSASPEQSPAKRKRLLCACEQDTCVCATVVIKTVEEELTSLRTMRKLLPFGSKALDARIKELERQSPSSCVSTVKVSDMLLAEKALEDERTSLRLKSAERDEVARKCFSFWWTLEQQFVADTKRSPSTSMEMLRWFWAGREDFVKAYRKRVGRSALNYL